VTAGFTVKFYDGFGERPTVGRWCGGDPLSIMTYL